MIITLIESGLFVLSDGKSPLEILYWSPGFFPFLMAKLNSDFIANNSFQILAERYGLDIEMLILK